MHCCYKYRKLCVLCNKTAVLPPRRSMWVWIRSFNRQFKINPRQPLPLLYLAWLSHPLIVSMACHLLHGKPLMHTDPLGVMFHTWGHWLPGHLQRGSLFTLYYCPSCSLSCSAERPRAQGWNIQITSKPREDNIMVQWNGRSTRRSTYGTVVSGRRTGRLICVS